MTDDFSNYPKSVGEAAAAREQSAAKWSPRDALIAILREIDRGEWKPCRLMIVGCDMNLENTYVRTVSAGFKNRLEAHGLLIEALHRGLVDD